MVQSMIRTVSGVMRDRGWQGMNRTMTKADEVYTLLLDRIMRRELYPGAPISEAELAQSLGISRTPVREALQRLRAENLVHTINGMGTFVKIVRWSEIQESYELIEALEGMCVVLIVQRQVPQSAFAPLQESIQIMSDALAEGDIPAWIRADEEFHLALWELCPNRKITEYLRLANYQVHYVRMTMTPNLVDKNRSSAAHAALYDALLERDAERAETLSRDHWSRVRLQLTPVLSGLTS